MTIPPRRSLEQGLLHAVKTTLAAALSMFAARALGLPEYYWAPISTIIIMQCVLGAVQIVSLQQLIGTALGSAAGALLATAFGMTVVAYLVGILGLGLLCAALRLDRTAYRFAGVTLTVIMLIPRPVPVRVAALHRFIEIFLGIVIAIIVTALWREKQTMQVEPAKRGVDNTAQS